MRPLDLLNIDLPSCGYLMPEHIAQELRRLARPGAPQVRVEFALAQHQSLVGEVVRAFADVWCGRRDSYGWPTRDLAAAEEDG